MFTRVKPSIIFSIWLGPSCLLVVLMYSNCKMFIIRLWDSHSRDPGQGRLPLTFSQLFSPPSMSMSQVSPQFAADKESNVSIPALFSCPHVCLDQSEARVQVTWSAPTNQKPDSGLNLQLLPQWMSDPICPDTGTPGHLRSGSQYKCTVFTLSPANPRVIYGLNDPPDASTGALIFAWFSSSESQPTGVGFHILWP